MLWKYFCRYVVVSIVLSSNYMRAKLTSIFYAAFWRLASLLTYSVQELLRRRAISNLSPKKHPRNDVISGLALCGVLPAFLCLLTFIYTKPLATTDI